MKVTITVKEVGPRETRTVEVRRVTMESHRRLTAHIATRILRREFPEFPKTNAAFKSKHDKAVFFAMHSLVPTKKCEFHFVWRHYYVEDAST